MIKPGEIQQKARDAGVRDQQIEKDYVLSWILSGISQHEQLSKLIVFKGGTVLKKVYFDEYRFSEDLDFTLLESVNKEQILKWFNESFEYVLEETNIRLAILDENEGDGINFYISYIGPLGGVGSNKKVKIDISTNEKLEFGPVLKKILLNYTDQDEHQLLCYTLEEILIEKMRTVMQRMQARDFFDIWYLLEVHGIDVSFYQNEFSNKCKSKNLDSKDFSKKLTERLPQYKGRWEGALKEQIRELPDFNSAVRETLRRLKV